MEKQGFTAKRVQEVVVACARQGRHHATHHNGWWGDVHLASDGCGLGTRPVGYSPAPTQSIYARDAASKSVSSWFLWKFRGGLVVFSLSSRARFRNRGWSDEWSTREVGGGVGAMADRCFPNTMRDYEISLDDSHADKTCEAPEHSLLDPGKLLKVAISLKDEVVQATWVQQGRRASDPTMYTGALGTAFLCFKAYQVTGSKDDLALCSEIVDSCATAAENMKKYVTFLCGQPGIYALGAAAARCRGDQGGLDRYLGLFHEASKNKTLAVGAEEGGMGMPYELLYGRAGFLWAALFVNKHVGEDTIPSNITGPVVDAILAGGRAGASQTGSPLMYQWHGTRYWGGAHGLAGIMHTLMHFPLSKEDADDVKGTIRYMIQGRFSSGNYPSSEGNARDRLIHWCHGAPGVAMTLCKATQVFPDAEEFRQAALEAGDVVWNRGLLRRLGLCHGISGNAYVFLSLCRTLGGKQHLFRAQQFSSFLYKHARSLIDAGEMHGGDRPYSLFEGLAGAACLFFDMTKPEMSRFPAYEL